MRRKELENEVKLQKKVRVLERGLHLNTCLVEFREGKAQ